MRSARTPALSETVDWKLIEVLSDQRGVLVAGGIVPMIVAVVGFVHTGHPWFVAWGVVAMLLLAARLAVTMIFPDRDARVGRPTVWRRCFLVGAWANGAISGVAAAISVLDTDASTQMMVITLLTAFAMGSAARNGVYPAAAIGSVILAELPLTIAFLAKRDVYYGCYAVFRAMFVISAISVVNHLYTRSVRFLVTDEENAVLVGEVRRTNLDLAAANENFAVANERLAAANEKLAAMAATDGLTGVPNRRGFDLALETEARSARRDAADLSLLMFDIDAFKVYNDHYGHQAGDDCLRRVAQTLSALVKRPRDVFARYGGEEFVAVLPQTNRREAVALAETMRAAVESLGLEHVGSAARVVTVSVGVATVTGNPADTTAALLRRADNALYDAKRMGRNRVVLAPDDEFTELRP